MVYRCNQRSKKPFSPSVGVHTTLGVRIDVTRAVRNHPPRPGNSGRVVCSVDIGDIPVGIVATRDWYPLTCTTKSASHRVRHVSASYAVLATSVVTTLAVSVVTTPAVSVTV